MPTSDTAGSPGFTVFRNSDEPWDRSKDRSKSRPATRTFEQVRAECAPGRKEERAFCFPRLFLGPNSVDD
jgi:hypothetical protein